VYAHDDHITVARELAEKYSAPARLHPADEVLPRQFYPYVDFEPLADCDSISVAGIELEGIPKRFDVSFSIV
jgi:glyoxylase-like metal-dependent hydrolase (beta-lactamase superfamily II)